MMITLMLALALVTIGLLAVLPEISQQVRRDREEELLHRGTAYMRAIQHFYKKFNRYPSRVEELENTNNLRYLRKRYTDPVNRDPATGKEREFKLLHQQDVSLNNGPLLPGQALPGQNAPGGPPVGNFGNQTGGTQQTGGANPQAPTSGNSGNSSNPDDKSNSPGSSSSDTDSSPGSGFSGPTFGGGPILGVASTSKDKTIRVFFDKTKYKDWLFIYLPGIERGGLLTGPVNPNQPPGGGLIPGQVPGQIPGQLPGQMPGQLPQQPGGGLTQTPPPSQQPPDSGQPPPQQ